MRTQPLLPPVASRGLAGLAVAVAVAVLPVAPAAAARVVELAPGASAVALPPLPAAAAGLGETLSSTVVFQGRSVPLVSHTDAFAIPAGLLPGPAGGGGQGPSSPPADPAPPPAAMPAPTAPVAPAAPHRCASPLRAVDAPAASGAASVQLVYAYPADRPDRLAAVAPALDGDATILRRTVAAASGGRKTLRFVGEAACGDSVDVAVVALPRPRAAYLDASGAPSIDALRADVDAALPASATAPTNHLVFADQLASASNCSCVTGTGQHYADSRRDSPSVHDGGGLTAAVWGVDGWAPDPGADSYVPAIFLHEISHTLGAVADDAPHATGAGHCTDGADVMCYADGGPHDVLTTTCPPGSGPIDAAYDCGGDDYFNADPTPGSYLAGHWNVYDSAFLEPATARWLTPPPAPRVPSALAPPGGAGRPVARPAKGTARGAACRAPTARAAKASRRTKASRAAARRRAAACARRRHAAVTSKRRVANVRVPTRHRHPRVARRVITR